jgi:DNA-binding transcriptional MerR regulator
MNNLYSSSEAREKLGGISPETLRRYVEAGKIRKETPPTNKKRGYYNKQDVDALAEAMQDFIEMHTLLPKAEASNITMNQAQGEDDIKETVQIARQNLGDNAYGLDRRMSWFNLSPKGDYVLKHNDIVVGYFSMQAIKPETVNRVFGKRSGDSIQLKDMEPIAPNKPLQVHISGLGIKKGISRQATREYGRELIKGIFSTFIELGKQGIEIKKIWGKSSTVSGIKLSRDLGFKELGYINNEQIGFVLDLDGEIKHPLVKKALQQYKDALAYATKLS